MPRTRDDSRVAEAARLYLSGMTRDQVATAMGVRGTTVSRWLADVVRPRGPRKRADAPDTLILELRDRDGLSFAEIGRRVHMSTTGARMRYYALTGRERPERQAIGGSERVEG